MKTKIEYEIYLRHGDEAGKFAVSVRKDTVDSDGNVINSEYIEGEIFDDYAKAKKSALQLEAFYAESIAEMGDQVNFYDWAAEGALLQAEPCIRYENI